MKYKLNEISKTMNNSAFDLIDVSGSYVGVPSLTIRSGQSQRTRLVDSMSKWRACRGKNSEQKQDTHPQVHPS